jgi:hypothetical protein
VYSSVNSSGFFIVETFGGANDSIVENVVYNNCIARNLGLRRVFNVNGYTVGFSPNEGGVIPKNITHK